MNKFVSSVHPPGLSATKDKDSVTNLDDTFFYAAGWRSGAASADIPIILLSPEEFGI